MQGQDFEGILSVGMLSDSTISVGESTEGAPFLGIALLGLGFCAAFAIWMRFWGDRLFMLRPEFASTPLRKLLSFVAWYLGLKQRQFEGNPRFLEDLRTPPGELDALWDQIEEDYEVELDRSRLNTVNDLLRQVRSSLVTMP